MKKTIFYAILIALPSLGWSQSVKKNAQVSLSAKVSPGCGQGDNSNNSYNGSLVSSDGMFVHADDFKVSAGETLAVKSVELSLFTTYGPIESVDLKFFSDDNGKPGSLIKTVSAIVPYAQISLGTVPGNELFRVYLDADLTFEGGNTGANYWMQPIVHEGPNGSQGAYWEFSTAGSLGAFMHRSESGGAWTPLSNRQAVFRLNCDHVVPEEPACNFNIMQDVEPITRMKMADVNHTSDAAVNGSPELEDFTNICKTSAKSGHDIVKT